MLSTTKFVCSCFVEQYGGFCVRSLVFRIKRFRGILDFGLRTSRCLAPVSDYDWNSEYQTTRERIHIRTREAIALDKVNSSMANGNSVPILCSVAAAAIVVLRLQSAKVREHLE